MWCLGSASEAALLGKVCASLASLPQMALFLPPSLSFSLSCNVCGCATLSPGLHLLSLTSAETEADSGGEEEESEDESEVPLEDVVFVECVGSGAFGKGIVLYCPLTNPSVLPPPPSPCVSVSCLSQATFRSIRSLSSHSPSTSLA